MKGLFRFSVFVILTLVWNSGCSQQGPTVAENTRGTPPNILIAIADDWSWPHAGVYGDPVIKTPTFDRVAREGVLFSAAFVAAPSCTPSRAALLTGQWHWRLEESANLWSTLQARFPVYPDLLEESGYFVGYSRKGWGPGKWEVGGRTRNAAGAEFPDFDSFLEQRPAGKPFCYWFGSNDPHRPYEEGAGAAEGMDLDRIDLFRCFPDDPSVRGDVADYYWEVQRFDRETGELLQKLESLGELENTVIVITGDNGMPFPRCKANLYDGGTRVPLAIRFPKRFPAGRKVDDLVSLTDLAPTFLELVGIPVPSVMTGRSLLPVLQSGSEGQVDPDRTFVLLGKERHVPCQEKPDPGGTPMRAIRTHDYLYIRNFRPDRWPAGTPNYERAYYPGAWYGDVDNGPTKFDMIENRDRDELHRRLFELAFDKRPAEELYDLNKDPDQLQNVASDPAYREVLETLSGRLMDELEKTDDPRLGDASRLEQYPYYGWGPVKPGYHPPGQ
jgi:N-sulfoglucosamine sulfohydrolase